MKNDEPEKDAIAELIKSDLWVDPLKYYKMNHGQSSNAHKDSLFGSEDDDDDDEAAGVGVPVETTTVAEAGEVGESMEVAIAGETTQTGGSV